MTDDQARADRDQRMLQGLNALRTDLDAMHDTTTQIRALMAEHRQGLDRARRNLDEAREILNNIEARHVEEEDEV